MLSGFRAIFHAGNSHFRANRGGAALCEQSGVRGAARGSARAQRETWELAGCPSVLQDARVVRPRLMGGKTWGGYQASFTPQIYVRFWCFGGGCQSDPAGAPPPAPARGPRHAPMTASHAKFQRQRCSGRAATVGGSIRRSTPRGPLSANLSLIEAQGLRIGFGGTLLWAGDKLAE